jgi:hypothetical protein
VADYNTWVNEAPKTGVLRTGNELPIVCIKMAGF